MVTALVGPQQAPHPPALQGSISRLGLRAEVLRRLLEDNCQHLSVAITGLNPLSVHVLRRRSPNHPAPSWMSMTTYAAKQPAKEQAHISATNRSTDAPVARRLPGGRPRIRPGETGRIRVGQTANPRGSDTQWYARARFRDYDGAVHDMRREAADPADARERLVAAIKSFGRDVVRHADLSKDMTVTQLSAYFLRAVEADQNVSATTYRGYAANLKRTVVPVIGSRSIRSIDIVDADNFVQSLKKERGDLTARLSRQLLRRMYDDARRLGLLQDNPFHATKSVKRPRPVPKAATDIQLEAFKKAAALRDSRRGPGPSNNFVVSDMLAVLIGTGCRLGEALALRWRDLDLESGSPTVTICGTVVQDPPRRQPHTKSEAGMRKLRIPQSLVVVLRARKARDLESTDDNAAVFHTRTGGWISSSNFGRSWRRVREVASRELDEDLSWFTPHSVRRTIATRIFETHDLDAAAAQLGHASSDITRIHYVERKVVTRPDMSAILEQILRPD